MSLTRPLQNLFAQTFTKGDLSPGFPALKGFKTEDQERAVVVVKKVEDSS